MRVRRTLISAALFAAAAFGTPVPAPAGQDFAAGFDVQALGFKVGEMSMTGKLAGGAYEVSAEFGTTGLIRLFRDMGFVMRSSGDWQDGPRPRDYVEQVNTGNRTSSARMRYSGGVPSLVGGDVDDGEVEPLDPATQGGTLDPLSALFTVLRDQGKDGLCQADMQIFDGGRRTRVILTGRSESRGEVTCIGQFRRIAGYPQDELETRRVVPLTITYARGENGVMQAQSAMLRTVYGPVGLKRRD